VRIRLRTLFPGYGPGPGETKTEPNLQKQRQFRLETCLEGSFPTALPVADELVHPVRSTEQSAS
jgi:hypothetical protein